MLYMCINDHPKIKIGSIKTNQNELHLRAKIWTVNLIKPQIALAVVCPLKRCWCCCLFTICRGSGWGVRSLYCHTVICVLSSFTIIPLGMKVLTALLLLSSECHVALNVICN